MRIPGQEIKKYAERYKYRKSPPLDAGRNAIAQGQLNLAELIIVAGWKSERRLDLIRANPDNLVREITSFSFSAEYEESTIGALLILQGVSFPTASAILHFCVDDSYPILDFRALWSLGIEKPNLYTTSFWLDYLETCRSIAKQHEVSVRELDKALWQYSSENQLNDIK